MRMIDERTRAASNRRKLPHRVPDLAWGYMAASWEAAWFPARVEEIPDPTLAMAAGLATLAHAVACRDAAGRLAPGGRQPQRSLRDGAASYRIREQPPAAGATP